MKYFAILCVVFALAVVTFAENIDQVSSAVPARKEAAAGAEPKDLETASSFVYPGYYGAYGGYAYPYYYPYYSYPYYYPYYY